jgi:hypothetical protein
LRGLGAAQSCRTALHRAIPAAPSWAFNFAPQARRRWFRFAGSEFASLPEVDKDVGLRCGDCGLDMRVEYGSKRRGYCPACGARRMARTAARKRDHVMSHVSAHRVITWHRLWPTGCSAGGAGGADGAGSGAVTPIQRLARLPTPTAGAPKSMATVCTR